MSGKGKYHHGDLRQALIAAAVEFLADHPPADLSIRKLARSLGISEAAPYHHFADRQALELAVMAEGYALLRDRCLAAGQAGRGLEGLCAAYTGFALDHPNLFRLIHQSSAARNPANAVLYAISAEAFAPLLAEVRQRARAQGIDDEGQVGFLALMVWTQLHGLTDVLIADFLRLGDGHAAFCARAYRHIEGSLMAALDAVRRSPAPAGGDGR
ncbi:TetR/AcrR family transcriptional regulator [Insolitispirillum peregrinum]|uniref:Transcriptional regulator, TetR family n=1 Tax=Insolitispirillum peregrinum TaxID=80876 RepID=A0A1N7L6J3_9PROT|nr:TetR/AcrR family transcriptional regulator [Insolitispirillum peregrinum]SIS69472.1 transcriptional regulator, TetR family [Insolitispirillum peregrinum]